MSNPFASLVTEASLAKLAGERSFARGRAYFENGAVVRIETLIQMKETAGRDKDREDVRQLKKL